jgi:plastocyanin
MTLKGVRTAVAVGATALMLGIAACGDDEDEPTAGGGGSTATQEEAAPAPSTTEDSASGGGGGEALTLDATEDGGLGFDPGDLEAPAGEVTITMANPDGNQMPHNVALEGDGVDEAGEVVEPGGESTVTATLEPGTYTFYCAVGQHRANGMEGTLTVE